MKVLVTGAAGFIGAALCKVLSERGDEVIGVDNLSDYYDVTLKKARLGRLSPFSNFKFEKLDIANTNQVTGLFRKVQPVRVVNLAAQAGVRYSLQNPYAYIDSNIQGFINILEACRHFGIESLVYASSSSVYGANRALPFSVEQRVDHPVSLYAASKRANELMAHSYSHLYRLPTTGLRFFTVYGPWGRPDMAMFLFSKNILAGHPIQLFNEGKHRRDFTYIDDIVQGVVRVLDKPAAPNPNWQPLQPESSSSSAPYRLYNIGNSSPVWLDEVIECLELAWGKKAIRELLPMQLGDVPETYADIDTLVRDFDYKPKTSIRVGIQKFVEWYRTYYQIKG